MKQIEWMYINFCSKRVIPIFDNELRTEQPWKSRSPPFSGLHRHIAALCKEVEINGKLNWLGEIIRVFNLLRLKNWVFFTFYLSQWYSCTLFVPNSNFRRIWAGAGRDVGGTQGLLIQLTKCNISSVTAA